MKKSYYDKKKNKYIDTTTNKEYTPKGLCEICKSPYFLTVHHFLNQQKCLNDLNAKKVKHPKMWTKEFIDENQKLFTLCTQCHSDVEHLDKEKFFEKYKREKRKYIFCEDQE